MLFIFVLPKGFEYDDPNTEIDESFPWDPDVRTNLGKVLELLLMGILRHVATLTTHINSQTLASLVSRAFFVLFIREIRAVYLTGKIGIHHYVEWGIGSMIGALMYIMSSDYIADLRGISILSLSISIACVILYLIHPKGIVAKAFKKDDLFDR